jgi:hypothetical protein
MSGDNFLSEALAKLPPAGFRKQRDYFYLVREPNLLVVFRKYNGAAFEGYYLAFTHTFFSNVKDPGGRYVIPTLLESYPVSLSITEIQAQFRKHPGIEAFDCDLNFVSRETTAARTAPSKSWLPEWLHVGRWFRRQRLSDGYSNDPVEVVLREGLQFMAQYSPAFTHRVLTERGGLNHPTIDKLTAECEQFLNGDNNSR